MKDKHYRLRFLPLFEDDLNSIVDYIASRLKNPDAAARFVDDVQVAIRERLNCAEAFEPYYSAMERQYPYYLLQQDACHLLRSHRRCDGDSPNRLQQTKF